MECSKLRSAIAVLAILCGFVAESHADCEALIGVKSFKDTTISSAKSVPADAARKVPAFCEVVGVITPVPGSRIGVVYRLPENWNGKMLGIGGGGYAGNVRLFDDYAVVNSGEALARGYATAQTDTGHLNPTSIWDSSWVSNPEALTDFAYRAVHLMTSVGKAVIAAHYGRPHSSAYFSGCSTGGRQALMEAQRFPDDYQGIVSGAPVYSLATQTNLLTRGQLLSQKNLKTAQVKRLNKAVLDACDDDDGVVDGIITDPQACKFDPAVLQCAGSAAGPDCLSPEQLAGVRAAYQGVKTTDGMIAAYPLTRGGEGAWARFTVDPPTGPAAPPVIPQDGGLSGFRAAIFGDANYDLSRFDAERDLKKLRSSAFADMFEADNPDLSAFMKNGGRLLLWHGTDDPGPSAAATADYYEAALRTTGPKVNSAASQIRFFVAPGVYHCRGGPGPDQIDLLDAIDRWVETGKAPDRLLATKRGSPLARPLCAYPALARYKGSGDTNAAASFDCR